MDIVKCSWSGGKDSSCAVSLHIEQGDKVKAVCYIPMFTKYIPLILKAHYEFIINTAEKFRKDGAEVHIVSGETYLDFFLRRASRGANKGRMFCFPPPITGMCDFKTCSKIDALHKCDVGEYDYADIGIAFDEKDRQAQLSDKKRSILVEQQITEKQAFDYCKEHNILSPHYEKYVRDGCMLCPNKKKEEREEWFAEYPEARDLVIALQNIAMRERPGKYPLRNKEWFVWQPEYEDYQYNVCDFVKEK